MKQDTRCSCHTKQMKRSWFVSVGQMIHPDRGFFVCICVLFLLVPLCVLVLLCIMYLCICVFVLPIQEWICVCRADDLSKLVLVDSIEALKREELALRHFLYIGTKLRTEDLGRIPLVFRPTPQIEKKKSTHIIVAAVRASICVKF